LPVSRRKLKNIFDSGFEAVFAFFKSQDKIISRQSKDIKMLEKRVKALEDRFNQNSTNSSRPPSSDWPTKKEALEKRQVDPPEDKKDTGAIT